jgi:hypothetical protein
VVAPISLISGGVVLSAAEPASAAPCGTLLTSNPAQMTTYASYGGHYVYYPPWTATCPTLTQNDAWSSSGSFSYDYYIGMYYTGSTWVYSTEGWQGVRQICR